jgi:predicted negative regulator of RcsB-dependent stress response
LGEYVCYDLDSIFNTTPHKACTKVIEEANIAADSAALDNEYAAVCRYREQYKEITAAIKEKHALSQELIGSFIDNNPNYFQVYNILGDYELSRNNQREAVTYWQKALSKEIPRSNEKEDIINKITKYD